MSAEKLIAQERPNIELTKRWIKGWETDAGRMVDEIYADPAKAHDPKIKKAMEEIKEAHSRVLAEQ